MTGPHIHRWYISSPVSEDNGPPTTSWHCRTCGETRLNVPEPKLPDQYFVAAKHQWMKKREL